MKENARKFIARVSTRLVVIILVLTVGVAGKAMLASLWKAPAKAVVSERPLPVDVLEVQPEDVPVIITGCGEVRALDVVPVTPEVSGRVLEIHPRLEVGERIPKGELLFRIDDRDYRASRDQAAANAAQMQGVLERLTQQFAIDRERLVTLERSRDLARAEYERVRQLLSDDQVGTQSGVDRAERDMNLAEDAHDQLSQAVKLYPIRIREAESGLAAARAQLDLAELHLERTQVLAPFDARVSQVKLESGQFVTPGAPVLTLADDSVLEISVPLDSRDAREWLRFTDDSGAQGDQAWFSSLEPVACRISWTEEQNGHAWEGRLHRVERFDERTRTITVAVRINGPQALTRDTDHLPLVEGMFCAVEIPGKSLHNVYRLPRWTVSYEGQVYLAGNDRRLQARAVEIVRTQGEESFVAEGLEPGELVVVTRLVNPLPNSLLEFEAADQAADAAENAS